MTDCCGCGYCCMKARCALGAYTYGYSTQQCPALVFNEGRFWCQLALESDEAKEHLFVGTGCSSSLLNTQREAFLKGQGEAYLKRLRKGCP